MQKGKGKYLIFDSNFLMGENIRDCLPKVIAFAERHKKPVVFKFNDIHLAVTGKSDPDAVVEQYRKKCDAHKRDPERQKNKAKQKFDKIKEERRIKAALDELKQTIIKPVPVANKAIPPIEVIQTLEQFNLSPDAISDWRAIPSLDSSKKRGEIIFVEADEILQSLLGRVELDQTLRTLDIFNGCKHHCDTCYADSAWPTKGFSTESMERLLYDPRFQRMLQPDSLRFGSTGDPLDHPDWLDITQTTLKATKRISDNYKIKIYTNYRAKREHQIDKLIELASQNPKRIDIVLSLPFNRNDAINEKFKDYYKNWSRYPKNISVQNVREPYLLFMSGRKLSPEVNAGRVREYHFIESDREMGFRQRGFVKTYLNPDALWLKVYATGYESHTTNLYTPITPKNIHALSSLPYHPDFPVPPHWPGGVGMKKSREEAERLAQEAKESQRLRPCTLVKSFPANRKVIPFCERSEPHQAQESSAHGRDIQVRRANSSSSK